MGTPCLSAVFFLVAPVFAASLRFVPAAVASCLPDYGRRRQAKRFAFEKGRMRGHNAARPPSERKTASFRETTGRMVWNAQRFKLKLFYHRTMRRQNGGGFRIFDALPSEQVNYRFTLSLVRKKPAEWRAFSAHAFLFCTGLREDRLLPYRGTVAAGKATRAFPQRLILPKKTRWGRVG